MKFKENPQLKVRLELVCELQKMDGNTDIAEFHSRTETFLGTINSRELYRVYKKKLNKFEIALNFA